MQYIIKIPIGDWSEDGHEKNEDFYIVSNYNASILRQAYKDSCKLMGVQFNIGDDYTGLKGSERYHGRLICTQYENSGFSDIVKDAFVKYDCPLKEIVENQCFDTLEEFVQVLLWFISKSMPDDFKWENLEFESLNGYWNKELNVQFGYGLFE